MTRILLIEDGDGICKIIAYDLKKADFDIVEYGDGRTAVDLAMKEDFDALIIDWMLLHVSGTDIVEGLRSEHIDAIFIILTTGDDETDILYAFEQGVDDYITKPFSPRELLARVNAHLKRQNHEQEKRFSVGNLFMDMKRREAYIGERTMMLTKKELDLLEYFIQNKDIVLSRDSILNDIWGFDYDGDARIVDVHVFKLRDKLNISHVHIRSSRGVGYLLEGVHETQ